jgi:predicted hotdog family 3-hydroxylacyl-ACP dehydratase
MIERAQIMALIPHQHSMCLHDEVLDWNAGNLRLRSAGHRSCTHPLRRGGQLAAVHLCEYGAQAMAVHGGLLAQQNGGVAAPGLLVSLRQVELRCARIDLLSGDLITCAERLHGDGSSWQYAFRVHHGDNLLASGRAAVMLKPL